MKNLKKKLAKKAGFTLVELIVVIAILAILAAVAVPAYTGYIQKAHESKVYSSLDALKTAVVFTATEKSSTHVVNVATITVTKASDTTITVTATATGEGFNASDISAANIASLFSKDNQESLAKAMKDANVGTAVWTASDTSWKLSAPTTP